MKAMVNDHYGPPSVLQLREVPAPAPGDDEVLVRVHAASINDWDWQLLHGEPFVNRLLYGWRNPKVRILGSDIAGRVEAVGRRVTRFRPGDAVYGDLSERWGGFAEYVCAPEKDLAPMPAGMSYVNAAAIPQAAMLAIQALRAAGPLQKGQHLLINGAGGGVGTFGVQLAKRQGAVVTGVDSAEKLAALRAAGFDEAIDYAAEDFTARGTRYDAIVDVKTNRSVWRYVRSLAPRGTYATVGGDLGRLFRALLWSPLISLLFKKRVRIVALAKNRDLLWVNEEYTAGRLTPVIDGIYPLAELPAAMQRFGGGKHFGKIVIAVTAEGSQTP